MSTKELVSFETDEKKYKKETHFYYQVTIELVKWLFESVEQPVVEGFYDTYFDDPEWNHLKNNEFIVKRTTIRVNEKDQVSHFFAKKVHEEDENLNPDMFKFSQSLEQLGRIYTYRGHFSKDIHLDFCSWDVMGSGGNSVEILFPVLITKKPFEEINPNFKLKLSPFKFSCFINDTRPNAYPLLSQKQKDLLKERSEIYYSNTTSNPFEDYQTTLVGLSMIE